LDLWKKKDISSIKLFSTDKIMIVYSKDIQTLPLRFLVKKILYYYNYSLIGKYDQLYAKVKDDGAWVGM